MEKHLTKSIEDYAVRRKIGLWRTHPSFFFVSLFFLIESAINSWVFLHVGTITPSYQRLFQYVPESVFGSFFAIGGFLLLIALTTKRHFLLRIGAGLILIPNMMMVANFLILAAEGAVPAIWVAVSKWTLTCLMLGLMMFEPFVNPNSAR